ncbi:MAG: NAD(P)H-dependent oxidoreductase subunit E, partial [Candidatus Aminicenantales bacterium]
VCLGTACHVRGGVQIVEEMERRLNIKAGQTTPDREFTLQTVNCLGCCAIGPVVVVDDKYYSHTTLKRVDDILKEYQEA